MNYIKVVQEVIEREFPELTICKVINCVTCSGCSTLYGKECHVVAHLYLIEVTDLKNETQFISLKMSFNKTIGNGFPRSYIKTDDKYVMKISQDFDEIKEHFDVACELTRNHTTPTSCTSRL